MFRSFFYAQFDCRFLVGIIPHAHAGKTRCTAIRRRLAGTHPRSRGENSSWDHSRTMFRGSSPLTRGKHRSSARRARSCGLIPAHAGKTVGRGRGRAERGAHPRSRGENCFIARVSRAFSGSSPLTRGKQGITSQLAANNGLIPAHAGKTTTVYRDGIKAAGSSPLTRGKHRSSARRARSCGLIPAHAGKTVGRGRGRAERGAHPRSRGENRASRRSSQRITGSSPLTRGKRESLPQPCRARRLIPAHAGKTGGGE